MPRPPAANRDVILVGIGSGNDIPLCRHLIRRGWRVHHAAIGQNAGYFVRGLTGRVELSEAAMVDDLLGAASRLPERPVLLPTTDRCVAAVLEDPRLCDAFDIPTVQVEPTRALFFKDALQETARSAGVPQPREIGDSRKDKELPRPDRWPVVVKPATPKEQMVADQESKVLNIDSDEAWDAFLERRLDAEVIVTECVPHERKALASCVVDRSGRVVFHNAFVVRHIHPPIDGNAVRCDPVESAAMVEHCLALAKQSGFVGMFEVEFLEDSRTGEWLVIDVQCRPTLQNAALLARGLDFDAVLRHLLDDAPLEVMTGSPTPWVDLPRLVAAWRGGSGPSFGHVMGTMTRLLTGRAQEATWSWRDPQPFLRNAYWSARR